MKVAYLIFQLSMVHYSFHGIFAPFSLRNRRERVKNILALFWAAMLLFGVMFHVSTFFATAETSNGASFSSIRVTHGVSIKELVNGGTAKIYLNQNPVYVNLTLNNINCTTNSGNFFRISILSVLTGHAWETGDLLVPEGTSEQIPINLCALYCGSCAQSGGKTVIESIWSYGENLSQPLVFAFRLYYYSSDPRVLEDEKPITLRVVQDFISVSQEPCKIEKGKMGTLETLISNLDDDNVYDVNVTIQDSATFSLTPNPTELGTIAGSSSKTAVFNAEVSNQTIAQSYNLTLRVGYRDLLGVSHVEDETVSIMVDPESTFPVIYLVAIIGVFAGAALSVLVLKKKGKINFKIPSK
jgi:hypothetical protein